MENSPFYLEWSVAFDLGIPALDAQHRDLMALVNAVCEKVVARHHAQEDALAALIDASRVHFAFEEELMRHCGFLDLAGHQKEHAELLASLERLREQLQREPEGVDTLSTLSFLRDWFFVHIQNTDSLIVPYFTAPPA